MGRLLTKQDVDYGNRNFWWYYITSLRGFDEEKGLNLNEALWELIDETTEVPGFGQWYDKFCPENEADGAGYFEEPNTVAGKLTEDMRFAIEFHLWQNTYYLNSLYIGNTGPNFEAWFLTFDELRAFDKYDYLPLLLLPMVGVEKEQRKAVEEWVGGKLNPIPLFVAHAKYIAKCIVNGLVMEGAFTQTEGVGITCTQNHSVRNTEKYPRYKQDVTVLNEALERFTQQ